MYITDTMKGSSVSITLCAGLLLVFSCNQDFRKVVPEEQLRMLQNRSPEIKNPDIQIVEVGSDAVELKWKAARDDSTPADQLQYNVYTSRYPYMDTVANVLANGHSAVGDKWKTDARSIRIENLLSEKGYFINVLVRDGDGSRSAYNMVSIRTAMGGSLAGPEISAGAVAFYDSDPDKDEIGGKFIIARASDETNIDSYVLYWGDRNKEKLPGYEPLAVIPAVGDNIGYDIPADTKIPDGAEYLLLFTANESGEMDRGNAITIMDSAVPNIRPRAVLFQDLDPALNQVQGTVTIVKAADETEITHYMLFWGASETEPVSGEAAVFTKAKTGDNITYVFGAGTLIPTGAAYLIAYARNEKGLARNGVSVPINETADLTPPQVISTSPKDGDIDVIAANRDFSFTFSEPIKTATVTGNSTASCSGSVQLSADDFQSCIPLSGTPTPSNSDQTFTITTSADLEEHLVYQLRLTQDIRDVNDNPMAEEYRTVQGFAVESIWSHTAYFKPIVNHGEIEEYTVGTPVAKYDCTYCYGRVSWGWFPLPWWGKYLCTTSVYWDSLPNNLPYGTDCRKTITGLTTVQRKQGGRFGQSVAVGENWLAVGIPADDSAVAEKLPMPKEFPSDPDVYYQNLYKYVFTDIAEIQALGQSSKDSGAVYLFRKNGGQWQFHSMIKAPNAGPGDRFGAAVSVSGNTLVVGAPNEDTRTEPVDMADSSETERRKYILSLDTMGREVPTNQDVKYRYANDRGNHSGAVYVFRYPEWESSPQWYLEVFIKAPNNEQDGMSFGSSVSLSGDLMVVGAPRESSSALNSGAAYVFERWGLTWDANVVDYLKSGNISENGQYGTSVAVSDHSRFIIVGEPYEDGASQSVSNGPVSGLDQDGRDVGAAWVYYRKQGGGSERTAYLKAPNAGDLDNFGASVSVSAGFFAIGAPGESSDTAGILQDGNLSADNNNASESGAVYIFQGTDSGVSARAFLKAPNISNGDRFGVAVAVSLDTVVVGAAEEQSRTVSVLEGSTLEEGTTDDTGTKNGAAYVFKRRGERWVHEVYLKAPNNRDEYEFGRAVSIWHGRICIGAPGEKSPYGDIIEGPDLNGAGYESDAYNFGAAYLFE